MTAPTQTLDTRGLKCPLPVIELARQLPRLQEGEVIAVISDDAAAATDIPAWCRMRGQEFVGQEPADGAAVTYLVRRRR